MDLGTRSEVTDGNDDEGKELWDATKTHWVSIFRGKLKVLLLVATEGSSQPLHWRVARVKARLGYGLTNLDL